MTIDIKHAFNPCEWRRDLLSGPDGIFVPESSRSTSATKEQHTRPTWREQRPNTFKDPVGGGSHVPGWKTPGCCKPLGSSE